MTSNGPPFDDKQPSGTEEPAGGRTGEPIESFGTGSHRSLAGRVSWALVSELANALVALAMFGVLYFLTLGTNYGTFAAVLGIAAIVGPISTFGANWLLIKELVVSDDVRGDLGRAVSKSMVGNFAALVVVAAVFLAIPGWFDGVNRLTIVLILVGQIPAYWLTELGIATCVAQGKLKFGAQLRLISSAFRLVLLLVFALLPNPSLDRWAWMFASVTSFSAIMVHVVLAKANGGAPRLSMPSVRELASGTSYGVGNTTEGFLAQVDKPILEQEKEMFPDASSEYSAGYRIMGLGLIPLMALLRAQDRRFFRQGSKGSGFTHAAAKKMSVLALGATIPVALTLVSAQWIVPEFFPLLPETWPDKLEVPLSVIRYIAIVPVLKGFQFAFGNSLTAAGNQTSRMLLTGFAALGNLLANLLYIPVYGWEAAAVTTVCAEIFLAIALAIASRHYGTQPSKSRTSEVSRP